jgi:NitT/TauT family transport system substrate-binding protein
MTGNFSPNHRLFLMGRRVRWAAAVAGVALVATACSSGSGGTTNAAKAGDGTSPEKTNLTVTYGTSSPSEAPLWIAVDEGIFAKHGLHVKMSQATSNVGALAVISGGADFYVGEATTTFQAVASGSPIQIVGNLRILNNFKFYVTPDITSPSQLKGKSLAISAAGDSTELTTRLALDTLKVSEKGITLLPTGTSSARLATLSSGKVAGTVLTEPTATAAAKQGMHLMLDQTKEPLTGSAVTISKSFAKKDPNTTVAFLESLTEAVKYLQDPANKQTCLQIIAKYTEAKVTDQATVDGYANYSTPGSLVQDPTPNTAAGQAILEGLKAEDPKRFGGLTLDQVFDTTLAQKLKDSGFLTRTWGAAPTTGAPSAVPTAS